MARARAWLLAFIGGPQLAHGLPMPAPLPRRPTDLNRGDRAVSAVR